MKPVYTCIIVDEDEIYRLLLLSHLRRYPFIEISGVYESWDQCRQNTGAAFPDIAVFDFDKHAGIFEDMQDRLANIPVRIVVSKDVESAVHAFDIGALDFVLKPFNPERLGKAIFRLKEWLSVQQKAVLLDLNLGGDTIFIKEGHNLVKLPLHEVLYLEASKDYTSIITTNKKHFVFSSLGNLLKDQMFKSFIRIHRSYAVQKHFVDRIKAQQLLVRGIVLPIGRSYREAIAELI